MFELVTSQIAKSPDFERKLKERNMDIRRILNSGKNKQVDEYGKAYLPKEHHGKWRSRFILIQNNFWVDIPMTVVGILSLLFIPLFQYCHDLRKDGQEEQGYRLIKILIWFNFIMSIFFALELAMKSQAFGIRRAYSQMNWVLKVEFFYQPIIWTLWFMFIAGAGNG